MARQALEMAAAAYAAGSESLADAALVLANRWRRDRRALALAALTKGVGANVLLLGGQRITLNGQAITLTKAA